MMVEDLVLSKDFLAVSKMHQIEVPQQLKVILEVIQVIWSQLPFLETSKVFSRKKLFTCQFMFPNFA